MIAALALAVPTAQTVHAVDIYYARAIGQEYLPEPAAPSEPAPARDQERPLPDLPGLGERVDQAAPEKGMSTWSKVLIGTVVVAAIAAIANNGGGGSAGVSVGTGGAPSPDPGTSSGGSGSSPDGGDAGGGGGSGSDGGDSGGGGGGIDIGVIPVVGDDSGNTRGRDRGDGDDD